MKRFLTVLLASLAVAGLAWVGTPVVLIRPFTAQTTTGLATAYAMRAHAGWITLAVLAAAMVCAAFLWPRLGSWWERGLATTAVVALAGCAWLARQNHFEWMFHPLLRPAFVDAEQADHIADEDLVLAIVAGGEARAYPVRALAYHHIVNDVLGGVPVVVTY